MAGDFLGRPIGNIGAFRGADFGALESELDRRLRERQLAQQAQQFDLSLQADKDRQQFARDAQIEDTFSAREFARQQQAQENKARFDLHKLEMDARKKELEVATEAKLAAIEADRRREEALAAEREAGRKQAADQFGQEIALRRETAANSRADDLRRETAQNDRFNAEQKRLTEQAAMRYAPEPANPAAEAAKRPEVREQTKAIGRAKLEVEMATLAYQTALRNPDGDVEAAADRLTKARAALLDAEFKLDDLVNGPAQDAASPADAAARKLGFKDAGEQGAMYEDALQYLPYRLK